jgi:hypothetical protein
MLLRVSLAHDSVLDFRLALVLRKRFRMSLADISLLGPVIKVVIMFVATRMVFEVTLPLPTSAKK